LPLNSAHYAMLYPQNGDGIVTIDTVMSLHAMYICPIVIFVGTTFFQRYPKYLSLLICLHAWKCMKYEVEGPRPRGRPKRTWREVVWEDCQARKLNKEDAMDRCKWRKVIKDVRRSGWVWVGECFFWYRPTLVVPDKRPLNGCVCVCVHACVCDLFSCTMLCRSTPSALTIS